MCLEVWLYSSRASLGREVWFSGAISGVMGATSVSDAASDVTGVVREGGRQLGTGSQYSVGELVSAMPATGESNDIF